MVVKKLNILTIGKGYLSTSLKQDKKKKFNLVSISRNKLNSLKKINNIDILLHPIGLNRHQSTINPKKAILVKKKYTNKIIEFAKKNSIKKIIYLSTIHVYSKNLSGTIKESTKCKNNHPYALAHLCAENILKKKCDKNLKVIILRLSNLFGIREKKNQNQFLLVVNSFMKQSIEKKKIIVKGKYIIRDFIPLNFFIKKLNKCFFFNERFRIINIGYKSYSLFSMAKFISTRANKLFNYSVKIIYEDTQDKNNRNNKLKYKSFLHEKIKNNYSLIKEIDFSLKKLN
jgi:nucleoside-diphosphate-sugar epimerase